MDPSEMFKFRKLNWQDYYRSYTTPRDWKKGARDIPFGQGAKSLYVDGVNGHDHNDGESWKTAFKTIQAAVDKAGSWTQIYIKNGTYAENVIVNELNISLIGENRDSTIISPASDVALTVDAEAFSGSNLTFVSPSANERSCVIYKDYASLYAIRLKGNALHALGMQLRAKFCDLSYIYVDDPNIKQVLSCLLDTHGSRIHHSYFSSTHGVGTGLFLAANSKELSIFENTFANFTYTAINSYSGAAFHQVFHNNFLNDSSSFTIISHENTDFFENYFVVHSNINNGFGIATAPFFFNGGSDPRPVIFRNGWNSVSLQRSLLRKKTGAQATQVAVDANGTTWVDLKSISPTTSDLELYSIQMTAAGTWTGTAKFRIIVGTTKVYPFAADADISSGTPVIFLFPINVQINETVKIQFRSDNAGDGAGETVALDQLDYAKVV